MRDESPIALLNELFCRLRQTQGHRRTQLAAEVARAACRICEDLSIDLVVRKQASLIELYARACAIGVQFGQVD